MAKRDLLTPEALRQLLRYEPETGKLFWRERGQEWFPPGTDGREWTVKIWNRKYAGKEAFTSRADGYPAGHILNVRAVAHRVAWAIHCGEWPDGHLDHANGDRADNRITNLRLADRSQNNQNVRSQTNSSSQYKGVTWDKSRGKWTAGIKKDFVRHNLGRFANEEDAARAHDEAALRLYGEYAKLNFPRPRPAPG